MSCKIKKYFCHISDSSTKKPFKILELFFEGVSCSLFGFRCSFVRDQIRFFYKIDALSEPKL